MHDIEILTLIRASYLSAEQKEELEKMLAETPENGEGEVLRKLNAYLEAEIRRRAQAYKTSFETFDASYATAEGAFDAVMERLEKETEEKLDVIADDDLDAREHIWETYDRELELLEKNCEEEMRSAAAAIMS